MVSKGRHPKNAINQALDALDGERFDVNEIHKGHRWGAVVCRACGENVAIMSTPKVPEHNARAIQRFAENHNKQHNA